MTNEKMLEKLAGLRDRADRCRRNAIERLCQKEGSSAWLIGVMIGLEDAAGHFILEVNDLIKELSEEKSEPFKPRVRSRHDGDCTIYASLSNENATDGICTCGYGLQQMRKCDYTHIYSEDHPRYIEALRETE